MKFSVKNKKPQKLEFFHLSIDMPLNMFPILLHQCVTVPKGVKSLSILFIPFSLKEIDKTHCTPLFPKDVCRTVLFFSKYIS